MKRPDSPLVALIVGAAGSAAANTAWTWAAGPVRVIAGLFTTALVPVAMHLWPKVPVTGWITRGLRFLVMAYICGAAAVVNLAHAVLLLTDHVNQRAEDVRLAVLSITAVEALMVMASLARRERPAASGSSVRRPGRPAGRLVGCLRRVLRFRPTATPVMPKARTTVLPAVAAQDTSQDVVPALLVSPRPTEHDSAGEGRRTVGQDVQDMQDTQGPSTQDDAPNTETDPVKWAAFELRAGRSAGYVLVGRQFPDLSERQAKRVAQDAKQQAVGLHVVTRANGGAAVGQ